LEDLWNKDEPKDENALSNRIKRHLDRDLREYVALANREAEVRRGEETDISVEALSRHPLSGRVERISLIIEVKGCWHRDLKTAMRDQLMGRYLRGGTASQGLYLVGWFYCSRWKRGVRGPKSWTVERARQFFGEQASGLSNEQVTMKAFVLDARQGAPS
jgi:hypothetical protein